MTADQIKALTDLLGHIEYVAGDDVDDPEDVLAELATNSEKYVDALKAALKG